MTSSANASLSCERAIPTPELPDLLKGGVDVTMMTTIVEQKIVQMKAMHSIGNGSDAKHAFLIMFDLQFQASC